jgi:hypothetical protein
VSASGLAGVVPMHYRTPRIGFLETADVFLERALIDFARIPGKIDH